jgi:IS5 family transposase
MIAKKAKLTQMTFYLTFEEQLNHRHPLYVLAGKIDWQMFEDEFSKHYSPDQGRPAKPIRLLTGLLLLKHIRNLSDESVVEQWQENSYYQYFCGMTSFVTGQPCEPSELVHFRNRIGTKGMELILKESVRLNGKDGKEKDVCVDTTVQEKNITFPTDNKLYRKIIQKSIAIAGRENIELRQSYRRTIKKLSYQQRFRHNKKQQKVSRKADRKIKTIAGRLVRELERKLTSEALIKHSSSLELFKRVLAQKRSDSNKVYSLHEPHVQCISKGKEHKKYEFGNKVSLMITKTSGVIVGALSLEKNDYDGHTLPPALEQYKRFYGTEPRKAIADLGYRGVDKIGETEVITPKKKATTYYGKVKLRADHRRRSSIEAGISHLKNNHRLGRNFYSHIAGDETNVLLSAAAYNFKRMMRKWKEMFKSFLSIFYYVLRVFFIPLNSCPNLKMTF